MRATLLGGAIALAAAFPGGAHPTPAPYYGLGPVCGFPTPFTGFVPGTDSGTVTRLRGTPQTRLVAHAGRGHFVLENLRIDVAGRPSRPSRRLPGAGPHHRRRRRHRRRHADPPRALRRDDRADVSGRNACGNQAWQHVDTTAGYLVVR